MNYLISAYANRVGGACNTELHVGGRIVCSKLSRFDGDNIKENALSCVLSGLRMASTRVTHEDLLFIEVQNVHLYNWLSGRVEHAGYSAALDSVFEALEKLDCQYKFMHVAAPKAKAATMNGYSAPKLEAVSVDSWFGDLGEA